MARRTQHRAVEGYWVLLCRLLARDGYVVSLDRIDHDPNEGWRIQFHAADPTTVARLHEIAAGEGAPGDLLTFGADEKIRQWLAGSNAA